MHHIDIISEDGSTDDILSDRANDLIAARARGHWRLETCQLSHADGFLFLTLTFTRDWSLEA